MPGYDLTDYEQDLAEVVELLDHPHRPAPAEARRFAELLHRIELYRPGPPEERPGDPHADRLAALAKHIERFLRLREDERTARDPAPGRDNMVPMLHLDLRPS
jgi:hypothetical protein